MPHPTVILEVMIMIRAFSLLDSLLAVLLVTMALTSLVQLSRISRRYLFLSRERHVAHAILTRLADIPIGRLKALPERRYDRRGLLVATQGKFLLTVHTQLKEPGLLVHQCLLRYRNYEGRQQELVLERLEVIDE